MTRTNLWQILGLFVASQTIHPAKAPLLFHFAPIYPSDDQLIVDHFYNMIVNEKCIKHLSASMTC